VSEKIKASYILELREYVVINFRIAYLFQQIHHKEPPKQLEKHKSLLSDLG
jgi:hypothetical protein